jgi:hypothetical protein
MPYKSKAEREATSWMTWTNLISHVQDVDCCDESKARQQIGVAIADRELVPVWADLLEVFWKLGGKGFPIQIADKPPRDAKFWQQVQFDPADPRKGQIDPAEPDQLFVGWDFDPVDPDVREPEPRFRKPMFYRDQALSLWPHRPPTAREEKGAVSLLTGLLKANPSLTFADALNACRKTFPKLTERGFRSRVWTAARKKAGLPEIGSPGRRKSSR